MDTQTRDNDSRGPTRRLVITQVTHKDESPQPRAPPDLCLVANNVAATTITSLRPLDVSAASESSRRSSTSPCVTKSSFWSSVTPPCCWKEEEEEHEKMVVWWREEG
ncbi:hypothetical protein E2C01_082554 [Portunus trituberculatus]|uniref:Uncharacterized protein n=1 Tax=Portunus trituberculatus TaxID=210409 RepID=A0A5B7IUW8_PORTR|nr:hypothetical protein [Portunus trituberculatus]